MRCGLCKTDEFQLISGEHGLVFKCKDGHETWLDLGMILKIKVINATYTNTNIRPRG